jgi:hypothetical protein
MNIKQIYANNTLAIQEGQSTCGPTVLLNALHLKNDFSHTEDELAKLCEAKVGYGTTAENLIKTARAVGLEVIEEKSKATVEDIERNIDDGACVIICYHSAYSGVSHYTLITEYDDRALYCRDSAFGLFRFSKEYFGKFWHGSDDASHNSQQWYMAVK